MNGTKLPEEIKELSEEKDITLFVDGDRGGKLIVKNVLDNANIKQVAVAPDGKEVEELTGKEILMNLRKKVDVNEFLSRENHSNDRYSRGAENKKSAPMMDLDDEKKNKLRELTEKNKKSGKAILLDNYLKEIKKVSAKSLSSSLKRSHQKPAVLVIDGTVTNPIINSAEESGVQLIVANNFATTETKIKLLSL